MGQFFSHYSAMEIFFIICAIVGGFFVIVKFVMQFIGLDSDSGHDLNVDSHNIDAHHSDSDVGFHVLSLHGITSFLMMFGLVGLAMYRQSSMGITMSLLGAVIAGCASVWIIGKVFMLASKMKSSGTISIDNTVGTQGKVYMHIPEKGSGRVLVTVNNSLREYDATSNNGMAIDTGTPIRVVWVDGNLLVVEKI
jgi:membrane protein implicated in regulation of membrane protease activity